MNGARLLVSAGAGLLGGALLGLNGRRSGRSRWPAHPALVSRPLAIGHRGAAGLYPENTVYGFRRARDEELVDAFEFDVRATADGHGVLLHDATVERTTDGAGLIAHMTLEQARQLDAGYRFTADDGVSFPFRGLGIRIPTIDEVLAEVRGWPLVIELKNAAAQRPLFDALERVDGAGWSVVAGEQDAFRTLISQHRGPISGSVEQVNRWYRAHVVGLGALLRPRFDVASVPEHWEGRRVVTPRFIRGLHDHGVAVHVWTVNDADDMRRLIAWDVDGLITDRPDVLRNVLPRRPAPASG